jgi:hypothetical protein
MAADSLDEALEALIDATLADSFPASDPPFWTLGCEPHRRSHLTANLPKAIPAPMLERKDTAIEAQAASPSPCEPKPGH